MAESTLRYGVVGIDCVMSSDLLMWEPTGAGDHSRTGEPGNSEAQTRQFDE